MFGGQDAMGSRGWQMGVVLSSLRSLASKETSRERLE